MSSLDQRKTSPGLSVCSELPRVRGAAAEEQHIGVVSGEQCLDALLVPEPVLSRIETGELVHGTLTTSDSPP